MTDIDDEFVVVDDHESNGFNAAIGKITLEYAYSKCYTLGDLELLRKGYQAGMLMVEFTSE